MFLLNMWGDIQVLRYHSPAISNVCTFCLVCEEGLPGITSGAGSTLGAAATPGPDFWTWVPPPDNRTLEDVLTPKMVDSPKPLPKFAEKELTREDLDLPLERELQKELPLIFQSRSVPSLPPLQSLLEVEKELDVEAPEVQHAPSLQVPESVPESVTEAVSAMKQGMQTAGQDTSGVHADGARWWREQGVENRANGVVCTWTVIRGVSADGSVEWEEKFWEAADAYDFKELGAEKSGRDSAGGVWREFWQESMWQVRVLPAPSHCIGSIGLIWTVSLPQLRISQPVL